MPDEGNDMESGKSLIYLTPTDELDVRSQWAVLLSETVSDHQAAETLIND